MATPILCIRKVSKQYASKLALDHINLDIPEGTVFGLLGPNGAGKTSLIRIITQITAPDTGDILYKNEPLTATHVSRMGYLPEERGLYKKMEVGEQILYLAQLKGLSRNDAIARSKVWIEKFEIKDWWKKKIEELSKGMQQKVQFITTVLHEPELIILDEPFTGFDPINAALVRDEILDMKKKGHSILFSTHRMESVEELCDHIALIHQSKKMLDGRIDEIRKGFQKNEYRVRHEGKIFEQHGVFTLVKQVELPDGHWESFVKPHSGISTKELVMRIWEQSPVLAFNEHLPSIGDIFIEVVSRQD